MTSKVPERDHRDGWVAEQCLKFLDSGEVDPNRPLFLYRSFLKPHAGFNVPKRFEYLYRIEDIDLPLYSFSALKPSTCTLHVEVTSFSPSVRTHIILSTQDFLTLDVSLSAGSVASTVQVSADAAPVDPSTASVSTDLDQRRLEDVPVLGRNPYITAKLSGVFVNTGSPQFIRFADQNGTSTTSVAGGPVAANLYLVDGVPITDTNNRPIVIPTIESIQDVKVQANTYDAQVAA